MDKRDRGQAKVPEKKRRGNMKIPDKPMAGKVLWRLAILALVSQCLGVPISSTEHTSNWSVRTLEHNKTYDASEVLFLSSPAYRGDG